MPNQIDSPHVPGTSSLFINGKIIASYIPSNTNFEVVELYSYKPMRHRPDVQKSIMVDWSLCQLVSKWTTKFHQSISWHTLFAVRWHEIYQSAILPGQCGLGCICGNKQHGNGVPFYKQGLTIIPACITGHVRYKVWDKDTRPFPNFNGATVEVREWLSNSIPHFAW